MRESLWDSLRRWRKSLQAKIKHKPFFDIKKASKNFTALLDAPVYLRSLQDSHKEGMEVAQEETEVIVSLTTFPARIQVVGWTLLSLFKQEVLPHRIVLNLALQEFPNQKLPVEIEYFCKMGLEILWHEENVFVFNKIMPTLKKFPHSIIVTCDDDQYYPTNWLATLLDSYKKNPNCTHAHRAHRILFENAGIPLPYNQWNPAVDYRYFQEPSYFNFATGVGGVLYPPNCFYKDVLSKEIYFEVCPKNDDIWLWGMSVLKGSKIQIAQGDAKEQTLSTMITQEVALHKENVIGCFNDTQMKNLLAYYPQITEILKAESGELLQGN